MRIASAKFGAPSGTIMNSCMSTLESACLPPLSTFIIGTGITLRVGIEIAIERHAGGRGGGVRGGERYAEHRVGAELGLVLGAVERDQPPVERALRGRVGTAECRGNRAVDVGDGAA